MDARYPIRRHQWPALLADFASMAGDAAALALAQAFGGSEVYVPKYPPDDHPITRALGRRAADALAALAGGGSVLVPLGPASLRERIMRAIEERCARGMSNAKIARELGVHLRTVERHRHRIERRADARQLRLFG